MTDRLSAGTIAVGENLLGRPHACIGIGLLQALERPGRTPEIPRQPCQTKQVEPDERGQPDRRHQANENEVDHIGIQKDKYIGDRVDQEDPPSVLLASNAGGR